MELNPAATDLRRFAQEITIVRRETFRAVEKELDAGAGKGGYTSDRPFEEWLNMPEIVRQLVE